MANEISPVFTHDNGLVAASPELPIKYTVPYTWGTLRVSEAADNFYGFVPLTARAVEGESSELEQSFVDPDFRTDMFLLSPQELAAALPEEVRESQAVQDAAGGCVTEFHKRGVAIGVAFQDNARTLGGRALQDLEQLDYDKRAGMEIASILGIGAPLDEFIGHEMSQAQVHALCVLLGDVASTTAVDYIHRREGQRMRRNLVVMGATRAGVTGGFAGFDVAIGNTGAIGMGILTGFAIAQAALFGLDLKIQRNKRHINESYAGYDGAYRGATVTRSLHDTFCARSFDMQYELMPEEY